MRQLLFLFSHSGRSSPRWKRWIRKKETGLAARFPYDAIRLEQKRTEMPNECYESDVADDIDEIERSERIQCDELFLVSVDFLIELFEFILRFFLCLKCLNDRHSLNRFIDISIDFAIRFSDSQIIFRTEIFISVGKQINNRDDEQAN